MLSILKWGTFRTQNKLKFAIYVPFPCNPFSYAYMEQIAMQLYKCYSRDNYMVLLLIKFVIMIGHFSHTHKIWIYYHDVSEYRNPYC